MARTPIVDLLNGVTRFGRLTVLGDGPDHPGPRKNGRRVSCLCDCGTFRLVQPSKLRTGQTLSCGCYGAQRASEAHRTHGLTNTPEYRSWASMKSRCLNPRDPFFERYGGRGITICDRWCDSFEAFLADMGPRPSRRYTLERMENDGRYEPRNCRWATPKEQASNTSVAHKLEHAGEVLTMAEASRRSGLARATIRKRMAGGATIEEAMSPIRRPRGYRYRSDNRFILYRGQRMVMADLCEAQGVTGSHVNYYERQGLTVDEAVDRILSNRRKAA